MAGPLTITDFIKNPDENAYCSLLKTTYNNDEGWSGGPVFHWSEDGEVILGALTTSCVGVFTEREDDGCVGATEADLSAGERLGALVVAGIVEWDPYYEFQQSPL